jgi:hypothetical protein
VSVTGIVVDDESSPLKRKPDPIGLNYMQIPIVPIPMARSGSRYVEKRAKEFDCVAKKPKVSPVSEPSNLHTSNTFQQDSRSG